MGDQPERERIARDTARGRRAREASRGNLGPVLKRWVASTISPTARSLRKYATLYGQGDLKGAGAEVSSPTFGAIGVTHNAALAPILQWCLKGSSPGVAQGGTTYADDLVLAVMGTAFMECSGASASKAVREAGVVKLAHVIGQAGLAARETALGQFFNEVQGAKAMERVRKGKDHAWQGVAQMNAVAALLAGQARSAIDADETLGAGDKAVVEVRNLKGEPRRLQLRVPDVSDWKLLDVARKVRGEADPHASTWQTFALLVLCAAQKEVGCFDLAKGDRGTKLLLLSGQAKAAIGADLDKWLHMGFIQEPMVVPPVDGDYLTVKHREVAGGNGPNGVRTDVRGTSAWQIACEVMAATPWRVADRTLHYATTTASGKEAARLCEKDDTRRAMVLGAYARLALEPEIYLPIYMDFRGRVYTRPNLVTYQGSSLQKALLRFPNEGASVELDADAEEALVMHMAALYSGPGKLDKAPLSERYDWYYSLSGKSLEEAIEWADEPLQLYTALDSVRQGEADTVACQIDGTCNGLQHLSAMFRDETAAPYVNLCAGTFEDRPQDLYARVAGLVADRLGERGLRGEPWACRLLATLTIDRKVVKKPVMVLPYGGTLGTIEEAAIQGVLDQDPHAIVNGKRISPWHECLTFEGGRWVRDEDAIAGNYLAFRERELHSHPLLRHDAKRLGGIIWACIQETLPRAMAAMGTFRAIAKSVKGHSLEWSMGSATSIESLGFPSINSPILLWVVQAKALSKADKLNMKGLHLPESVRGLKMRRGRDEVDPTSHTSGIVANFIHSQDADHLARTMAGFASRSITHHGPAFGAIHDCYLTRPSLMASLRATTRHSFFTKYGRSGQHPLEHPVRMREVATRAIVGEWESWYSLADSLGVSFPVLGSWEPSEVLDSAWFFS